MDYAKLEKLDYSELKDISSRMYLKHTRSKKDCLEKIIEAFKEYENYKKSKIDKYKKGKQLGLKGKEGIVYSVKTKNGREYAMKTFKKSKSSKTLLTEMELQKLASKYGISPKIIDHDTVTKYIVMEKLDIRFIDTVKKQKGKLTKIQQNQILEIIKKLDNCKVLHNDPNPLNFMFKDNKLYIIDYGFAKKIDEKLIKKYNTNTPNRKFMLPGFLLKMREIFPNARYNILIKELTQDEKELYGFKKITE